MYVDIHCHLLPGLDDGPETLERALHLARHAVAGGITRCVTTPHILPGRYDNTLPRIREATAQFRDVLARHAIPLAVGYAAEIRVSPEVITMAEEGQLPVIGSVDGYQVVLLEFPDSQILPGTDKLLAWLLNRRYRPLIAHPERNKAVMKNLDAIAPFVEMGCWLQLTGGSVSGVFGPRCRERSRELLERGWINCIASDAHDSPTRLPGLEPARLAAAQIVGDMASWNLVQEWPDVMSAGNAGFHVGV